MTNLEEADNERKTIDPATNPAAVKVTLEAIVSSEHFAKAERLKNFLTYVVEEAIAGRADTILGKTIAQDVYGGSGPTSATNAENLVRVDAGRLRRKLEDYYETDGAHDQIKVVIASGGYAPTFIDLASNALDGEREPVARSRRRGINLVSMAMGLAVGLVGVFVLLASWPDRPEEEAGAVSAERSNTIRRAERDALVLKSAASVQALNLCDQARGFLFPVADPGNQKLAVDAFTKAIETDPDLPCGYAGAAHGTATLAILMGDTREAKVMQQRAISLSQRAVEMSPTNGWSLSAAAWAAYSAGQFEEAENLSALAERLAPNDGNVLDFRTTISLGLGNFEAALRSSDPNTHRNVGSFRFARRNLRAVAWFHAGAYDAAIQSLEDAIQSGDPVSALTLTYLSASHWAAGNKATARKYTEELVATWPEARPDIALGRLYSSEELSRQIVDRLVDAGWSPAQ